MLEEYNPKLVDKDWFIEQYYGKPIEQIIGYMGYVSEACKTIKDLKIDPDNEDLGKKVYEITLEMHKLIQEGLTKNPNSISRYTEVLDDLMQGYRKILKERHEEL